MGASDSKALPPWHASEGVEYSPLLTQRIQSLSLSAHTFLQANSSYYVKFEIEAHLPRLQGALQYDNNIARWYPKLVPRKVTEEEFWRNYFSHVAAIVTEGHTEQAHAEAEEAVQQVADEDQESRAEQQNAATPSPTPMNHHPQQTSPQQQTESSASPAAPTPVSPSASSNTPVATPTQPISPPEVSSTVPSSAALPPPTPPASSLPSSTPPRSNSLSAPAPISAPSAAMMAVVDALHTSPSPSTSKVPPPDDEAADEEEKEEMELALTSPVMRIEQSLLAHAPVLRWGIIGCGQVVQRCIVPALMRTAGARIVSVVGRTPSSRHSFSTLYPSLPLHGSIGALLCDPTVDAVIIATPPGAHQAIAIEAAKLRKPCVIERPMGRNTEEARSLTQHFLSSSLPLYIDQHKRFLPKFLAIRQLLHQGALGTVQEVRYRLANSLATQLLTEYTASASASAPPPTTSATSSATSPPPPPCWRLDASSLGGGLFLEFGTELFDVLQFVFGDQEGGQVTNVQGDALHRPALSSSDLGVAYPPEMATENHVTITFRLGENQSVVAPASTPSSPPPPTPILCSASFNFASPPHCPPIDELLIEGSLGQLSTSLFRVDDAPLLRFFGGSKEGGEQGKTVRVKLPTVEQSHAPFLQQVTDELRVWRSTPPSPALLSSSSAPAAVRTAQVVDAVLRRYYRHRQDFFWRRPDTWQHGLSPSNVQ